MLAWPFFTRPPLDLGPRRDARAGHAEGGRFPQPADKVFRQIEARQIDGLIRCYRQGGGLLEANALAVRMRARCAQPVSRLARWIVSRDIVVIAANGALLVPLFQLDEAGCEVRPAVGRVLLELHGVFDDRETAQWFVQPNAWIDDRWPMDLLDSDPHAVVEAARADRYIARG